VTEPANPHRSTGWTAGRITLVVIGSIAALLGAAMLVGGGALLWADQTQRDEEGYLTSPAEQFESSSYAIVSEPIDLVSSDSEVADWFLSDDVLGDVRLRMTGDDVFLGVGRSDAVEEYLGRVERDRVSDLDPPEYEREGGGAPESPPAEQDFWVATASGSGEQALTWRPESANWTVVVMNVDASAGVAAELRAGAEVDFVLWVAIGLLIAGAVFVLGGAGLIYLGARHSTTPATASAVAAGAAADPLLARPRAAQPTLYPVAVIGELQPDVSRWLWLVKWLLAIPHYIVLVFLWIAYSVLTLIAGFAILFTGRYPRGIFDFNVGVLRWTWRVGFYSYWANGTDHYPPFSLREEAGYPARLDVRYPEQLSRWLWLVKWLLAIPHLILVGIFVGGWGWAGPIGEEWRGAGSFGLVGLLVVIACVVLLFTGRYPPALFDFALGLDRWAARVAAYVGLMTDDYPPFRLDMGPHEPPARPDAAREASADRPT
jgi:hypothetical protein